MAQKIREVRIDKSGITIARWQNDGKEWNTIEKSYKDKSTGQWKKSTIFFDRELSEILYILKAQWPEIEQQAYVPSESDDQPF